MFSNRYGLPALLKDGYKTFTGVDQVTAKNIEACKTLTDIVRTSLGPCGLSKLIVTSLGRRYVTGDAATISKELEVQHPAAKLLVMAAEMQKQEMGGGCAFLLIVAGTLLTEAEYLLRQGLHLSDVIRGYEMALEKVPSIYEESICNFVSNVKDVKEIERIIRPVVSSKALCADIDLAAILAPAIAATIPPDPKGFDPENVRVSKLQGGRFNQTTTCNGIIITRPPTGCVESKSNCNVMVLGCGLECTSTEAKGTVLLHTADELKSFTKGEEMQMEQIIKDIKDAGVDAIIVHGGGISDVAQHFCDKYQILTLKVQSKFETRRLCKALGATAVVRLGTPMADELGVATSIKIMEVSSKRVTQILCRDTRVQTVILRGATPTLLDEAEKAIDDACSVVKATIKDPRFVAGAGAIEIAVARKLQALAAQTPGVEQYAVLKAAEAFESIPRILAENSGHNPTEVLATLHAAHASGNAQAGVNIDTYRCINVSCKENVADRITIDSDNAGIHDHLLTKMWAVKLASDAVLTILKVDQIIMARPAGGPAPRAPQAPDVD